MELGSYIEEIHRQLALAADAGGEEARRVADRLVAPMDAAIRLAFQDLLSAAAEEITCELAPGSVELRLRGRDLELVVTPPPAEPGTGPLPTASPPTASLPTASPATAAAEGDDGSMARINLRLPEQLKGRIERAAGDEGVSVNSWIVRAASARLDQSEEPRIPPPRLSYGSQRFTGWAR